jgi:DNA-binding response OmpR family regulator
MSRHFNVLLVEDDKTVQFAMNAALVDIGHRVSIAGNKVEAISLLSAAHALDVVLLDLNLDGERGEDIFLWLAANHITFPPVIILSAQPMVDILKAARMIPASKSIQKPATMKQIHSAMEGAVAA